MSPYMRLRPSNGRRPLVKANKENAHFLSLSGAGEISVGPVMALPGLLAEFGVDPQRALAAAGIKPQVFDHLANRMPLADMGRLLNICVEETRCEHFGLLLGDRFEMRGFGPLGYLLQNSATVGDAVRMLVKNLHWHDRGAVPVFFAPSPSKVTLGYSIYNHETEAIPQIYDTAIMIGFRIMHELCGPDWKPAHVQLAYRKPVHAGPHRQYFQSQVQFNAEISGIVFESSDLKRPIAGADPILYRLVAKALADEMPQFMSFSDEVREVLYQLVLSGTCSTDAVAHLFGLHERTLRRRLEDEGSQLHALIKQARCELAQQMLENTERSVASIAASLGYADANAFSRAFHTWSGVSPKAWRSSRGRKPQLARSKMGRL